MPEDDFDIYGEDEGFNLKVDEVCFFVCDTRGHANPCVGVEADRL